MRLKDSELIDLLIDSGLNVYINPLDDHECFLAPKSSANALLFGHSCLKSFLCTLSRRLVKKFLSGDSLAKVWDRGLAKVWLSEKCQTFRQT